MILLKYFQWGQIRYKFSAKNYLRNFSSEIFVTRSL